jgi:peptide/nickel transport system substrate-binding protein
MNMKRRLRILAALAFGLMGTCAVQAADLRFAIGVGPTTLDPHFHNYFANQGLHPNLYEGLVDADPEGQLKPVLAESWEAVEPTVWEFRLRKGVKFHDGADFTAEDVASSIDRLRSIEGSPGSLAGYVNDISEVKIVDDFTIRFVTKAPSPLLPNQLIRVLILDSANKATTAEIDAGNGAIGTGPYKNTKYVRDNSWQLARNDVWWGAKQPWDNVTFRSIPNEASRLAAFLAGDFDILQGIPLANIKALSLDNRFTVYSKAAMQSYWIAMDTARAVTPEVTDASGAPLDPNPLIKTDVRKALLMSIDRKALVDRFMEGYGEVANQVSAPAAAEGITVEPVPYDPVAAKALLAQAGYPDGFSLVLTGLTGVVAGDELINQAIGQFFARIGVRTDVNSLPPQVAIPRAVRGELSMYFTGTPTPDAYVALRNTQMTVNKEAGLGAGNRLNYSNPDFDVVMKEVLVTIDDAKRHELLAKAVKIITDDVSVIPLFHPHYTWATRAGLVYEPAALLLNQAVLATPAK